MKKCLILLICLGFSAALGAEDTLMFEEHAVSSISTQVRNGEFEGALATTRELLRWRETRLGAAHPALAPVLKNEATLLRQLGRPLEAEARLRWALAIQEKAGVESATLASYGNDLGELALERGAFEEAAGYLARSPENSETQRIQARLRVVQKDWPGALKVLQDLRKRTGSPDERIRSGWDAGWASFSAGHPEQAATYFSESLELAAAKPLLKMEALEQQADFEAERGRLEEAAALRKQSAAMRAGTLGADRFESEPYLFGAGILYSKLGRYAEAESLLKRSLGLKEKSYGGESGATARAWQELGSHYRRAGSEKKASSAFASALRIWKKVYGDKSPYVAACLSISKRASKD
ncbi:MAG: tetratricopeptide repeat protein [candidate division FCPU426 bacterium]